jgi:hypothetical protein
MNDFRLVGLAREPFAPLFEMSESSSPRARSAASSPTTTRLPLPDQPGRCRARRGIAAAPVLPPAGRFAIPGSGPIFIRNGARQRIGDRSEVAAVRFREADLGARLRRARLHRRCRVCAGTEAAASIRRMFENPGVRYIHLHNAKRGCFSCRVERA